jgi:TIR domain
MPHFFISYRRDDSGGHAGRLYDRLSAHFGAEYVFIDIDTIEAGSDFVAVIENTISQCDILLVLIGKRWLSITDATGQRRLDNPEDFVRLEVQAGLERNIRVIPILVGGAMMPSAEDLPDALTNLARLNVFELSDIRWHTDVGKLIEVTEKILGPKAGQIAHDASIIRVRVHRAYFRTKPEEHCFFINVVNSSQTTDIEITHVWYENSTRVDILEPRRPLPRRLRPNESWETWIRTTNIPADPNPFTKFRVRISTGKVFSSEQNRDVPPRGFVPGG